MASSNPPEPLRSASSGLPAGVDDPAELGALAYLGGRSINDNPYPIPGRRAAEWDQGFLDTEIEVEVEVEYGGES